jgi:hypothetical protein
VKDFMVKNHLWVFVNCQIENPAFDSQVCCKLDAAPCLGRSLPRGLHAPFHSSVAQLAVCATHLGLTLNDAWLEVFKQRCQTLSRPLYVQTKETLTLKASSFGSKCELSSKFIDSIGKSGVTDSILAFASFKQNKELAKTDGAKRSRLLGEP